MQANEKALRLLGDCKRRQVGVSGESVKIAAKLGERNDDHRLPKLLVLGTSKLLRCGNEPAACSKHLECGKPHLAPRQRRKRITRDGTLCAESSLRACIIRGERRESV